MTTIELIAKDQGLTAEEKPVVASGNQNTVVIEIDYSNEWDGYAKSAVFFTENNPTAYEVAVENNKCIIPHEVLADVTKLYIGLRGVKEDEVKASSLVKYNVVKGAPVGEGTAVDATPTPYQQVLSRTESLQGQINEIVIEATGTGDASAEVAQARVPEYGTETYPTLQARLNASDAKREALAAEIEQAKEPGEYGTGYPSLQERFKANEDDVGLLAGEIGRAKEAPDGTMFPTLKERLDNAENTSVKQAESVEWLEKNGNIENLYILPDGCVYGCVAAEKESIEVPNYTNVLPTAINSDGTDFVGTNGEDGYKTDCRVSSSGEEKTSTTTDCTGYIPVKSGDVIRIKNIEREKAGYSTAYFFTSSFAKTIGIVDVAGIDPDSEGIYTFTIPDNANTVYTRITVGGFNAESVITVNEEITTKTVTTVLSSEWGKTENTEKFERKIIEHDEKIFELEKNTVGQAKSVEWLKSNGDAEKLYILPDGYVYKCDGTGTENGKVPNFTNVLSTAISSDGTDYKGLNGEDGYKTGYRVSSSGEEKELSTCCCTGFIPVKANDIIRYKTTKLETTGYGTLYFYNADFAIIPGTLYEQILTPDSDGVVTVSASSSSSCRYFRLTSGIIDNTSFITVNEEITYTEKEVTATEWEKVQDSDEKTSSLMYISPTGSDSNDGLTAATPKKTVKACVSAGATKISAKRGVYNEIVQLRDVSTIEIFPTDNDKSYVVGEEKRQPIVFEMADYKTPTDLVTYNSIKRLAYSYTFNTQFDKVFVRRSLEPVVGTGYGSRYNATVWLLSEDEKTVCIKLKPVLTVSECEAETNTFTYVDGYVYINADTTGVENIVIPTNWDSGFYINGAERVDLKEVEVKFSGTYNIDIRNCVYFELYKCSSKYTSYASGIHPFNSNGVLTACYATKCFDGFGVSGYGHTTYIDCVSEFNFDDGVSHHDGTEGTFIGGRYEGNGKGGNTPAYGAKVNIYGGIYKNNASFGIGYLSATGQTPASGMVHGAVIVDNTVGLSVNANCDVTLISPIFKDNETERDIKGNITEF